MTLPPCRNRLFTFEQAREIRAFVHAHPHLRNREIAEHFGVPMYRVVGIILGTSYKEPGYRPPEGRKRAKLTWPQVRAIRDAHAIGVPQKELARRYNVSGAAICFVVNGKNWRNDPLGYVPPAQRPWQEAAE